MSVTMDTRPEVFDLVAEQSVLGAAMLSPQAAAEVVTRLTSGAFYRPAHRTIFEAINRLFARGAPVEPGTVLAELQKAKLLDKVGGGDYLHTLTQVVVTPASVGTYIGQVAEAAATRDGARAGHRIARIFENQAVPLEERIAAAYDTLDRAVNTTTQQNRLPSLTDAAYEFLDWLEAKGEDRGVTTGWADLDALLGRLQPGQLVVIGARPGIGKTVSLVNLALHVALVEGAPVLFASLEMSRHEIMQRVFARLAQVNLTRLRNRDLGDDDWSRIAAAVDAMNGRQLFVDDSVHISVPYLRARLAAMCRTQAAPALVCVDYLQLLVGQRRVENRTQEITEITRALKLLAKEFDVPVVVGSQLNRASEMRSDKRPTLADLRESGSIEQDADVVILLHREDAYDPESSRAGEVDLIVAKNRQGPTGTVTLAAQLHYCTFADMGAPEVDT